MLTDPRFSLPLQTLVGHWQWLSSHHVLLLGGYMHFHIFRSYSTYTSIRVYVVDMLIVYLIQWNALYDLRKEMYDDPMPYLFIIACCFLMMIMHIYQMRHFHRRPTRPLF